MLMRINIEPDMHNRKEDIMEKIIMEIVKYLYDAEKDNLLNYWEKLSSGLLEEKIDEKNFMHMFQFFVLAQTIGACLDKDTVNSP